VCGVPQDQFRRVCELLTANSGRDRTGAFVYSVGWTQHTAGVQYIRAASILQALLGNIGRPGGGILALRGHASIQGSTDTPTLFDLLPGYLHMPHAHTSEDLDTYVGAERTEKGFWGNMRACTASLLKAWRGDAATAENDFCRPRCRGGRGTGAGRRGLRGGVSVRQVGEEVAGVPGERMPGPTWHGAACCPAAPCR
jgi:formate dehydrogenase major subunit